jgi:hypothetical protein
MAPIQTHAIIDTLFVHSDDPNNPLVKITVLGTGINTGDLAGGADGINILDVIALIKIIIGTSPEPQTGTALFQAADVNGDDDINVLDIVKLVHIILNPPQVKTVAVDLSEPAHLDLGVMQILENRTQHLPIELDYTGSIAGMQFTLTYDPTQLQVGAPVTTDRLSGMSIEYMDDGGEIRMLIYSAEGQSIASAAAPLFYLPVELRAGAQETGIAIDDIVLASVQGHAIQVLTPSGSHRVAALPTSFALKHNAPNPFNPSTTIAYEVPQKAHISLTIYNLLGQEVVRLVDEPKLAGRYEVIWHGLNGNGQGVASGIYMYRLTTDTGFTQVQRMTLLK